MTAIEYLLMKCPRIETMVAADVLDKALAIERRQTINFAEDFARNYIGFDSVSSDPNDPGPAAHYYNQKYKKQ